MSTSSTSTTSSPTWDRSGRVVEALPIARRHAQFRPSTPPRSTNAPKLTIEATTPSDGAFLQVIQELAAHLRLGLLQPEATGQHHVVAVLKFSSMILASISLPHVGLQVAHLAHLRREAGRKPRSPMSRIRPPLTTSMTVPLTASSFSLSASMVPQ